MECFELSIIIFRDIKSWSAISIEPGQTVWMCWLAWVFTAGKILSLGSSRVRIKNKITTVLHLTLNNVYLVIFFLILIIIILINLYLMSQLLEVLEGEGLFFN